MKKLLVIFAALCILSMSGCFSSWDGSDDQGSIVISLGDSEARYAGVGPGAETGGEETAAVEYIIILTSPGKESRSRKLTGEKTAAFSVQPGLWTVAVRRENSEGRLNGYGEENEVEVKAGATASAFINMSDLVEVGGNWGNLKTAIEGEQEELVMLTSETLTVNDSIEIPNGKNITILARNPVTIIKGGNFSNSMFRVPRGSSLTLGVAGGMGGDGEITFDGNNQGSSSLIYVGTTRISSGSNTGDGGKLIMYDGVTLTNNRATINDRGGAIVVQGGTFIMNGGTISKNSASNYGGGVRVLSGTFIKAGGTIYGSNGGDNSNTATNGGHAVYFDVGPIAWDDTLGPNNNL
jgi:hypothetical protein